ncbi:hypothetical protein, partial [Planktotalea arctica]|uniref:hypothetical protein n=1 Tax=Planktotalea arctica TaxID=1481893 RepID=UPI00321A3A10
MRARSCPECRIWNGLRRELARYAARSYAMGVAGDGVAPFETRTIPHNSCPERRDLSLMRQNGGHTMTARPDFYRFHNGEKAPLQFSDAEYEAR